MNIRGMQIDHSWTLFLDRDGVINKKIDHDYVRRWADFEFLPGVRESLAVLAGYFGRIIIITNQRGIAKGLYTVEDLHDIHAQMLHEIRIAGGRVDGIFFCPHSGDETECDCRKPKPGMAYQAKRAFPEIDFHRSVLVGDSASDIELGVQLGMKTVYVSKIQNLERAQYHFPSLAEFAASIAD